MGRQSARIFYNGKDHKEFFYNGKYHDALWLNGECLWEKIGWNIIDTGRTVSGITAYAGYVPLEKFYKVGSQYLIVHNDDFTGILNRLFVGNIGIFYYSGMVYYAKLDSKRLIVSDDCVNWYTAVFNPDLQHSELPNGFMINDWLIYVNNAGKKIDLYRLYKLDSGSYIEYEKSISFPNTITFRETYPVTLGTKAYMGNYMFDFTGNDIGSEDIKTVEGAYRATIYNAFCTKDYIYVGSQAVSAENPLIIQRIDKYGTIEKTWKFLLPEDEYGKIGANCHYVYRDKILIVYANQTIIIYGLDGSDYKKTIPVGQMGYETTFYVGCVSGILEKENGVRIILTKNGTYHLLDIDLEED